MVVTSSHKIKGSEKELFDSNVIDQIDYQKSADERKQDLMKKRSGLMRTVSAKQEKSSSKSIKAKSCLKKESVDRSFDEQ